MGDRRAPDAVGTARRLGVGAFGLNSGLLTYAEAIIAGRAGDRATARRLAVSSEGDFVNCTAWADVARWLAAESAADSGRDQPTWWLSGAGDRLAGYGLRGLAKRCRDLAGGPQRWAGLDITAREADVLSLVVEGLANKEIAARLALSPRTVEKHVEARCASWGRARGRSWRQSPRPWSRDRRTISRAVFRPGWRWSEDVKPLVGTDSCQASHLAVVISGRFHVQMDNGDVADLGPGDAHVASPGHDAWVVGEEPCVIVDFAGTLQTGARVAACPCGVSFRIESDDALDHLIAAVQEHARGSHDHSVTREHTLTELTSA